VLTAAPRSPNFKDVISTIMLLNSPLSIKSLGYLLQLEAADILQALLGIQSILMIPGDDDDDIQLFHASLREFLTTKSRSGQFFIDSLTYHMFILGDCLNVLKVFPNDGCFFMGEVQKYACNNWCHHFYQALIEGGDDCIELLTSSHLMTYLTNFVSHSLQFWVNTLIMSGQWQTLNVLHSLISQLKQLHCSQQLLQILEHIYANAKMVCLSIHNCQYKFNSLSE